MNTSQFSPSAPVHRSEYKYPELLTDSTNFRIKKIMDDEKLLHDEIKFRNKVCKKYGRCASFTSGVEYILILADVVLGTAAVTIPGVGSLISAATFSGVGLISGVAKLIQNKLNEKKLKHYRLSIVANTTLNNLHQKISKAITDGQISHEEFEDIQHIVNDWKKAPAAHSKQTTLLNQETINLLNAQAAEKVKKDLVEQLKQIQINASPTRVA
jgi:Fe-S cluster biosynthesis and repair protein YggX